MDFDILKFQEESTTVHAESSEVVSLKKSNMAKIGFRRFENGRIFQSSRLGDADLDILISESKKFGGPGVPQEFEFQKAHIQHKEGIKPGESAVSSFQRSIEMLKDKYPQYVFSGQCTVLNQRISLSSSYGHNLSNAGGLVDWYILYQRKGSGNMLDGHLSGVSPYDQIEKSVKQQELYMSLGASPIPITGGRLPVLLVEEMPVLKRLLDSFRVNNYKENSALYSGRMGQLLFNKKVNLVDSGYDSKSGKCSFFDGEGVVREDDLYLIRNGEFHGLISDLRNEKKYGYKSTGNGVRLFNRGVSLEFKSLRFKPGNRGWMEILKELPLCIVAVVAIGGESNDLGEYSSPVQIGYIFEYGKVIGLCPQVTVKTSINHFLGDGLVDISSDGFTSESTSPCVISEMDVFVN